MHYHEHFGITRAMKQRVPQIIEASVGISTEITNDPAKDYGLLIFGVKR